MTNAELAGYEAHGLVGLVLLEHDEQVPDPPPVSFAVTAEIANPASRYRIPNRKDPYRAL